jgi:hypothetical protein
MHAHTVQGCVCDEGWAGYDCSQRQCPRGDDVDTPAVGQQHETIRIGCSLTAGRCDSPPLHLMTIITNMSVMLTVTAMSVASKLCSAVKCSSSVASH